MTCKGTDRGAQRGPSIIHLEMELNAVSSLPINYTPNSLTFFGALESNVKLLPVVHVVNPRFVIVRGGGRTYTRRDILAKDQYTSEGTGRLTIIVDQSNLVVAHEPAKQ